MLFVYGQKSIILSNLLSIFTARIEELYAFAYCPKNAELTREAGWTVYDPTAEYERMEVPKALWTKSSLNENYGVRF